MKCQFDATDVCRLPEELQLALSTHSVKDVEFIWVVSDVEDIVVRHGPTLNLVQHAWIYPEASPSHRCMGVFDMGIFAFQDSLVSAKDLKSGLSFQCVSKQRVSVHSQKGGMCCSPNNAKFTIETGSAGTLPLTYFYSLAIDHRSSRACVSLQWIFHRKLPGHFKVFEQASTLFELLPELADRFGAQSSAVVEAFRVFDFGTPLPPRPSAQPLSRTPNEAYTKPKDGSDAARCDSSGGRGSRQQQGNQKKASQRLHVWSCDTNSHLYGSLLG